MRALALSLLLTSIVLAAQTPQTSQSPLAGLFPEQTGPPTDYAGYAYEDCAPWDGPAVKVVALQGLVPEGVPRTPPRPSIELIVYTDVDRAIGQQVAIASNAVPGSAMAMSCPVVGNCAPAQSGTITITSRGENGALTGEFRAKWPIGAPRAGRFTVGWRETLVPCG